MLSANTLLFISTGYVALLFLLAFFVDRRTARLGGGWLRSPLIYTLSLSVYCTFAVSISTGKPARRE